MVSRRSGQVTRGGALGLFLTPSHVEAGVSLPYLFIQVTLLEGVLVPQSAWGSHSKACLRRDHVSGVGPS